MSRLKQFGPILAVVLLALAWCSTQGNKDAAYGECRAAGRSAKECLRLEREGAGPPRASRPPRDESSLHSDNAAARSSADSLVVMELSQSSDGVSESQIDQRFISGVEAFFVEKAGQHYRSAMLAQGFQPKQVAFQAGTVIFKGPERIAITTLQDESGVGPSSKVAWWIQGQDLKRVTCTDLEHRTIAVRAGKCGEAISRFFGYRNWNLDPELRASVAHEPAP